MFSNLNNLNIRERIKKLLKIKTSRRVVFQINNYCNLHCEYCNYCCNIPINHNSENIWRRIKKETEIEEAILYCDRFKDIKIEETQWTGGEPTLLPENKFNKLVEVFYFYKKDINLLTNGYNILNLDKKILQKIKTITFDNHGINENHINNCIKFLKSFYRGNVKVWTVKTHLDLRKAMKHPSNKEKMCSRWLKEIKINDYVVYPCCTMPAMMILDNNSIMREELINAGWTLRNKEIIKTILNYQRTLPDYIMNQCLNNCWMPNVDVGQDRKRITLKPNDVLFRKKE